MSFSTKQVLSERLMVPRGAISAIRQRRQVQRPRLSPDLLRFAAFFSTAALHAAAEFRFERALSAWVLAEVSAFRRLSPPGISHVSAIVAFTGDLTVIHPASLLVVLRELREWARSVREAWVQLLAPRGQVDPTGDTDLTAIRLSIAEPEVPRQPANPSEQAEIPDDDPELLLIQAWATDTEGDFIGILCGEVDDDHLAPITSEALVFLTQLLDDLQLDILSRCDERPRTVTICRTLQPVLLWSTCTELDGENCFYPSQGVCLVIDVTDLSTRDPLIRRIPAGETGDDEEEEESGEEEEKSDDPDYRESEDEVLEEEEGEDDQEEGAHQGSDEEEAVSTSSSGAVELTKEEQEQRRRRQRSGSGSSPSRAALRIRSDAGARASSPVVIPLSP
ncbi:hypothetical protein CBR_g70951 [Chara braunii]|uniref:Uncharacterized protein n=1 Tax=Chara braunii TaxID=69332 RepID=A0A388MG01_CHABU|nr:hypothetical protein CBR_g70951 [Chara braunii]|eukprot:GBG93463.1 hypothetical protein CBR_g70951 [Chara braunii]